MKISFRKVLLGTFVLSLIVGSGIVQANSVTVYNNKEDGMRIQLDDGARRNHHTPYYSQQQPHHRKYCRLVAGYEMHGRWYPPHRECYDRPHHRYWS